MNATVEKNNPGIFPKNEGKINSKGMVAPPVPPNLPKLNLLEGEQFLSRMEYQNNQLKIFLVILRKHLVQQCENLWKTIFI